MMTEPRPTHGNGSQPTPPSDAELIQRAHSGDEEAFELLFRRYEAVLRARIRQTLPPNLRRKVSTSDLLQETRIVALGRCHEFEARPDGTFQAWLLQILRNKVGDVVRRYTQTARRGDVNEVERGARPGTSQFLGNEPSPSQHAIAEETNERIREAMRLLPDDHREVIGLIRFDQLTLTQAASRMGRSPEAVRKLFGRALVRFKEVFDELEGQGE